MASGQISSQRRKETFKAGLRRQTIIEHLTTILQEYSSDEQILKELIQNADDAGAREVKFLLDRSQYGTDPQKLFSEELAQFQGPALYAYNDALFTDDDWKGLLMLNQSVKKNDPTKVGRFGLGFKSIFHITDFPGVLSGDCLAFIDPYEKYFENKGHKTTSNMWVLSDNDDSIELQRLSDQFQPFYHRIFNTSAETLRNGGLEGTLFRFPLRKDSASRERPWVECTPGKIRNDLFDLLEKESDSVLLFLNHIEKIEVYEKLSLNEDPELVFRVEVGESCIRNVQDKRNEFCVVAAAVSKAVCFPMVIESESRNSLEKTSYGWIVSLYHAQGVESREVDDLRRELQIFPLGGVALSVYWESRHKGLSKYQFPDPDQSQGQVFCFLKLPLEEEHPTGINAHVHGYFVLDQNRRNLKWPAAGHSLTNLTDPAHRWNCFLKKTVLPRAMTNIAEYIPKILGSDSDSLAGAAKFKAAFSAYRADSKMSLGERLIHALLPNPRSVKPQWTLMESTFYGLASSKPIFCYVFPRGAQPMWISAFDSKIIFDDTAASYAETEIRQMVLSLEGRFLIPLGSKICKALDDNSGRKVIRLEFTLLCSILKKSRTMSQVSNDEKLSILKFMFRGLTDTNMLQLSGVSLLPLNNGDWTSFSQNNKLAMKIFIKDTYSLLPGLERRFVLETPSLPYDMMRRFEEIAIKGALNIATLEPTDVMSLLREVDGLGLNKNQLLIRNSRPDIITAEWLERLWQYLHRHRWDLNLSQLEDAKLHIIPQEGGQQLALLSRMAPVIMVGVDGYSEIVQFCRQLGITVLREIPYYVMQHPQVYEIYLQSANSPSGLLAVLQRLQTSLGANVLSRKFGQLDATLRNTFRRFLANNCYALRLNANDLTMLNALPVFPTVPCSGFQETVQLISLKAAKFGARTWRAAFYVAEFILDLRDPGTLELARMCGFLNVMQDVDFLSSLVIPSMNDFQYVGKVEQNMQVILGNFQEELRQHGFLDSLKNIKFVATNQGQTRVKPSDLYDDSELLQTLFSGSNSRFPTGTFAQPIYRPLLLMLGLRGLSNVRSEDIIQVANNLQQANPRDPKTCAKFKALLELLNQSQALLRSGELEKLRQLRWIIPVATVSYGYQSKVLRHAVLPGQASSLAHANLVGSVNALVSTDGLDIVANHFGWNEAPKVVDVINHLSHVIECQPQPGEIVNIRRVCEDIYRYLQDHIKSGSANENDFHQLSTKACIFVDQQFIEPFRCAFNSNLGLNCLPFMASIPPTMETNYGSFLRMVGVREAFGVDDYISALRQMYDNHVDAALAEESIRKVCIIVEDMYHNCREDETANGIIRHNKYRITVENEDFWSPEKLKTAVYLPDNDRVMRHVAELCYIIADNAELYLTDDIHVCHPLISLEISKWIGVKSMDRQVLADLAVGMPFGQKEELTNRIKRLLTGYPFDSGILKELVQNADDAGATELDFILDARCLDFSGIAEGAWKWLEGPALCVFNDKPFSDEDLKGIQKLGEGSKAGKITKIGKFGVGFNCVYHVTDVPCFLTNVNSKKLLCAFDPTCKNINHATKEFPGYSYDADRLRNISPGIFDAFMVNEYSKYGENGTMFRFPFRSHPSDLSNDSVSLTDIQRLFDGFEECIHECLLFVRNVTKISLRKVDVATGKICDVFSVQRECHTSAIKKFYTHVDAAASSLKSGNVRPTGISKKELCYRITTRDTKNLTRSWLVASRLGIEQSISSLHSHAEIENLQLIPYGAVAFEIKERSAVERYQAIDEDHMQNRGILYCSLPLPYRHGLPVHVNGHFALDYENRRNIWNYEDAGSQKNWNICLMEHVIACAYVVLLTTLQEDVPGDVTDIHLMNYLYAFPRFSFCGKSKYFEDLCVAVYKLIASRKAEVLPAYGNHIKPPLTLTNLTWVHPLDVNGQKPCFATTDLPDCDETTRISYEKPRFGYRPISDMEILREVLVCSGYKLILPSFATLFEEFNRAGIPVEHSTPENVINYYRSEHFAGPQQPCALDNTPFKTADNFKVLLRFCSRSKDVKKLLLGAPFLLTADNKLQVFDAGNKKFVCRYSCILPHMADQFISWDIVCILKIESEDDVKLCKHFGISELVTALSGLFPAETFSGGDQVRLLSQMEENVTHKGYKTDGTNGSIACQWLSKVWNFLNDEVARSERKERKLDGESETGKSGRKHSTDKPTHTGLNRRSQKVCCFARTEYTVLRPISNWCLIPVVSDGERYVTPISNVEAILNLSKLEHSVNVVTFSALIGLGIPDMNKDLSYGPLFDKLLNNGYRDSVAIVIALCAMDYSAACERLSDEQADALAHYLCENVTEWSAVLSQTVIEILRRMPLFVNIAKRRIRISDYNTCCILPASQSAVPDVECRIWMERAAKEDRVGFLPHRHAKLMDYLQCTVLTEVTLYTKYIFECFDKFSEDARLAHLTYIRDNLMRQLDIENSNKGHKCESDECDKCQRSVLCTALRALPFIYSPDENILKCASAFYDRRVELFAEMLDDNEFPSGLFRSEESWPDFLCCCGLIAKVTGEMLIKFAKKIGQGYADKPRNKELQKEVDHKVKVLLEVFRSNWKEKDKDNTTLCVRELSWVPFIPAHVVSQATLNLHPQFELQEDKINLIPLNGSVACTRNTALVWTCRYLIPSWVLRYICEDNDKPIDILGFTARPPVGDVTKNLKNVCMRVKETGMPRDISKLSKVLYRMFDNIHHNSKHLHRNELSTVSCILVQNRLVLPGQVVVKADFQIPPYLFELPLELGQFVGLMKLIGVDDRPAIKHYANVLGDISRAAAQQLLNDADRRAAKLAIYGILAVQFAETRVSCAQTVATALPGVQELYLLCEDGRLYQSNKLIVRDNQRFAERTVGYFGFDYLFDLRELRLNFGVDIAYELLRLLPEQLRPRFLSDLYRESLKIPVTEIPQASSLLAASLHNRLIEEPFRQGIYRLAKHQYYVRQGAAMTNNDGILRCLEKMNSMRFVECQQMFTYLEFVGTDPSLDERTRGEIRCGSEMECAYFVDAETFYISQAKLQVASAQDSFYCILAEVLDRILDKSLTTVLHHVLVLLRCDLERIQCHLNDCGIRDCEPYSFQA